MIAPTGFACWSVWAEIAKQQPLYLVDRVVHGSATLIVGPPFVGKTTLVSGIATALSKGLESFADGLPVRGRGTVMVAATDPGEPSRWGTRMEIAGIDARGVEVAAMTLGNRDDLFARAASDRPALFILDNLTGACRGNINDAFEVAELLSKLTELTSLGIPVVVIHHTGKPYPGAPKPKTPMGSQYLSGWARLVVNVDETADGQLRLDLKTNDAPGQSIWLAVERGPDGEVTHSLIGQEDRQTKRKRKEATNDERRELGLQIVQDPELARLSQRALAERLFGDERFQKRVGNALKACGAEKVGDVWVIP